MPKPPRPWIVTPHGPIENIDDNLWGVTGEVPGFPKGTGMQRRMCIVKLSDGRLAFHNAVPLEDAALAKVLAWGTPSLLIAPVWLHAMDAPAFANKLKLEVFSCAASVPKLRGHLPHIKPLEELPADPALSWTYLRGTRFQEPAFTVHSGPRASLLFVDAWQNSRPGKGLNAALFKLFGFTGAEPRTPPFYKWRAMTNREDLKADLLRLADTPGLARLVPSHGAIVSERPMETLRDTVHRSL